MYLEIHTARMVLFLCTLFIASCFFTITYGALECLTDGEFSLHPTYCDKYFICDNGLFTEMSCTTGYVFNPHINLCVWQGNVSGCAYGYDITTQPPETSPCVCEIELSPLYHMLKIPSDHHHYTPSKEEADRAVKFYGFTYSDSPGLIASNALDCHCRASLKYPTRLYRRATAENPIDEHFFTLDSGEIDKYVNGLGYKWEGWESYHFYCSTIAGNCGATVPLHRYVKNSKHYFSTTMDGQGDATYEGVTCYIWPTDYV